MSAKKLKDTKLGAWLREKAPNVLDKVGDVLPDEGALGIVKNLISADEKDAAYAEAMADAEREAQANVTARWQADMQSDERLAKLVRPLTLIVLLALYLGLAIADSVGGWNFEVKEQYIDLLQILSLTAFGAYFAGRSLEKTKK
jgi:hypothetical protein